MASPCCIIKLLAPIKPLVVYINSIYGNVPS